MNRYLFKRLADKSAFVVFERDTYKTLVIQIPFIIEVLSKQQHKFTLQSFMALEEQQQLDILADIDLQEHIQ